MDKMLIMPQRNHQFRENSSEQMTYTWALCMTFVKRHRDSVKAMYKNILHFIFIIMIHGVMKAGVPSDSTSTLKKPIELRVKALGFVIIEDLFVGSLAVGAEWPLGNKYSIITDIVHLRWREERELYNQPNPDDYVEYAQIDRKNYYVIEARRYIFNHRNRWNKMYLSAWHKGGIRRIESEQLYLKRDHDIIQQHSHFYDIGGALGVKLGEPCWYFDISMGCGFRREFITEQELYHPGQYQEFKHNITDNRYMFHIRINFSIPFCK